MQIRSTGWDERKSSSFGAPGFETASIPLKNPEGFTGEEEVGGINGQSKAGDGGEGAEGEDTKWAERGIRGLKARVGRECSISKGGQNKQWRYTGRRMPRRKSECYK